MNPTRKTVAVRVRLDVAERLKELGWLCRSSQGRVVEALVDWTHTAKGENTVRAMARK